MQKNKVANQLHGCFLFFLHMRKNSFSHQAHMVIGAFVVMRRYYVPCSKKTPLQGFWSCQTGCTAIEANVRLGLLKEETTDIKLSRHGKAKMHISLCYCAADLLSLIGAHARASFKGIVTEIYETMQNVNLVWSQLYFVGKALHLIVPLTHDNDRFSEIWWIH